MSETEIFKLREVEDLLHVRCFTLSQLAWRTELLKLKYFVKSVPWQFSYVLLMGLVSYVSIWNVASTLKIKIVIEVRYF